MKDKLKRILNSGPRLTRVTLQISVHSQFMYGTFGSAYLPPPAFLLIEWKWIIEVNLPNGLSISKQHVCDAVRQSPHSVTAVALLPSWERVHVSVLVLYLHVWVGTLCLHFCAISFSLFLYDGCLCVGLVSECHWFIFYQTQSRRHHLVILLFLWQRGDSCNALIWIQCPHISFL